MSDLSAELQRAANLFAQIPGGAVESYGEWGGMGDFSWQAGVRADAIALRCTVHARPQ